MRKFGPLLTFSDDFQNLVNCENVGNQYANNNGHDIYCSSKLKKHQETWEQFKYSGYPEFIQNFIIRDNFLNILSFSANANHTVISAYGPDLENNNKIYRTL